MNKINVKIEGIHCDNCRNRIVKVLSKIDNIKDIVINDDIATIKYEGELNHKEIIDTLNDIGFNTKEEYFN